VADQAGVKTIKGTPAFMAPEMLLQQRADDGLDAFACDLYSVGACVYMFHEGRPPYYERNEIEMVARLERGIAPSFSRHLSRDPNLVHLLHGLLQIDPLKRFTIRDVVTHAYTTREGSYPMYANRDAMEHALKRDTESRKSLELNETKNAISMATLSYGIAMQSSNWLKRARSRIEKKLADLSVSEAEAAEVAAMKKKNTNGTSNRQKYIKDGQPQNVKSTKTGWSFRRVFLCCGKTSELRDLALPQPMEKAAEGNVRTARPPLPSVASSGRPTHISLRGGQEKEKREYDGLGYTSSSSSSDDDDDDGVLLTGQSALDTIIIRPVGSKYSVLKGTNEVCNDGAFRLPSVGKPPAPGSRILELLRTLSCMWSGNGSDGSNSPKSDAPPYGLFSSKTVCETNEDRACALMNSRVRMFGVFDGHNGSYVSEVLSRHLLANANAMLKGDAESASQNRESKFRELFCAEEKNLMSCLLAGFQQAALQDDGSSRRSSVESAGTATAESISERAQHQHQHQHQHDEFEARKPFKINIVSDLEDSIGTQRRLSTRSEMHGYTNLSSAPGSTATLIAILKDGKGTSSWMHVAWVGDSRAVLSSTDGSVVVLTEDHRASNPNEEARMKKVGGIVSRGRTFGSLQLSRSFGDPAHKEHFLREHFPKRYPSLIQQLTPKARMNALTRTQRDFVEQDKDEAPRKDAVISTPGYLVREVAQSDEFVLVASDGFFDVMSNEEAVAATRYLIADEGLSLAAVAERLVWFAAQRGTEDNCTVVVASLA
jgi:serine/threonine protein phosphatase PrpC